MDRFARIVAGRWTERSSPSSVPGSHCWPRFGQQIGALESKEKNKPVSFLPGRRRVGGGAGGVKAVPSGRRDVRHSGIRTRERADCGRPRGSDDGPRGDQRRTARRCPVPSPILRTRRTAGRLSSSSRSWPAARAQVLIDAVQSVSETVQETSPAGLTTKVTGPSGYSADASKVFEGINSRLLLATTLLVFVLLVFIYRSPIFWILPLALRVPRRGARARPRLAPRRCRRCRRRRRPRGSLLVLVFGARTRVLRCSSRPDTEEELVTNEDRHERWRSLFARQGRPSWPRPRTVVAALLCSARLGQLDRRPGPDRRHGRRRRSARHADGAARAAPPRRAPRVLALHPHFGAAPAEEGAAAGGDSALAQASPPPGLDRDCPRLGSGRAWLADLDDNLTTAQAFRGGVESVEGQELLERSFPAGASAPSKILVTDPDQVGRGEGGGG